MIRSAQPKRQIGAILRYEFMIQWRQRTWLVAMVPLLALACLLMLGVRDSVLWTRGQASLSNAPAELLPDYQRQSLAASTLLILSLEPALQIFSLLLIAVLMADVIPKDAQWGIRELFQTMPLTDGNYLTGKLVATLSSTLVALGLPMIGIGVLWWFLVYPYDVGSYILMCVVGVLPAALLTGGLAMLIAAGQPSRRRAVVVGFSFGVILLFLLPFGLTDTTDGWGYLNPARPVGLRHYTLVLYGYGGALDRQNPVNFTPMGLPQFALVILIGAVQIGIAWFIVRAWLRRQAEK